MRTFFALDLAPALKLDIDQWRDKSLPPLLGKIPVTNFHITLCFNGHTNQNQLNELQNFADKIQLPQFQLDLDEFGFFSKTRIAFLGCSQVPEELISLNKILEKMSHQLQLSSEKRAYTPHVSLFRKTTASPPAPIIPPKFKMKVSSFTLFESVALKHGVRYQPIFVWQLERKIKPMKGNE